MNRQQKMTTRQESFDIPTSCQQFSSQNFYQTQDLMEDLTIKSTTTTKESLSDFFIGSSGQNMEFLQNLIQQGMVSHKEYRSSSQTKLLTKQKIKGKNYENFRKKIQENYNIFLNKLKQQKVPFHSHITCGHMKWDISIPSIIGYFATLLYNPNNVAFDASQVTTMLEIQCMNLFAKMISYPSMINQLDQNFSTQNRSWGHFTSGGSVANSEAIWGARNMKYLPFSLRCFIDSLPIQLSQKAQKIQVRLVTGQCTLFNSLSVWQLLNITSEDTMDLYQSIFVALYGRDFEKYSQYSKQVLQFTLSMCGYEQFQYMLEAKLQQSPDSKWSQNRPPRIKSFVSSSGHYSFMKSACLLGLGQKSFTKIQVDVQGRLNIADLQYQLCKCAENHIPVLTVVAVLGSSQSGAIDNIIQILRIKSKVAEKGLSFHFHIDGAYGGYYLSMIRNKMNNICSMSEYTEKQLSYVQKCDSITIDPHKTGYVPYQCGLIFYKDHRFRFNLNFSAPYMLKKGDLSTSIYGIQGSKAGSTTGSVYMAIKTMPLQRQGHGQLLQNTMINTKILTASLKEMKNNIYTFDHENTKVQQKFACLLLKRNFIEKDNGTENEQQMYNQLIAQCRPENIYNLLEDNKLQNYYKNMGPDLNIICYAINFVDPLTGVWNQSLKMMNRLNQIIIRKTRPQPSKSNQDDQEQEKQTLFLSSTTKSQGYSALITDFVMRHNCIQDDNCIHLIRSAVMNPFFISQNIDNNSSYPMSSNTKQIRFTKELANIAYSALKQLKQEMGSC